MVLILCILVLSINVVFNVGYFILKLIIRMF
jgi:hypothetical protein